MISCPQRQQWLRAAVSEALGTPGDARGELQRCLRVLAGPCPGEEAAERGPGDTGGHERALEELAELCESLDNATGQCRLPRGSGVRSHSGVLGRSWG